MTVDPDRKPKLITKPGELEALCDRLVKTGWFGFDTEFVGEDQFRPEVCLIQAATDEFCALIDPLNGLDVHPFWELIADERLLVIVHSGNEDISQCWKEIGKAPRNVFDLQVAAGIIGLGYPMSLSRLAKATVGRKIHKSQTLTDWRQRPLSDDQIRYAVEDVASLRSIYDKIHEKLVALDRQAWVQEECDALCLAAGTEDDEKQKLKRLKGCGSLSGRELAIAYALLDVREELASQYNRPVRSLLKDHLVVEIARRGWTSVKRIQSLRGLNLGGAAVKRLADAVEAAKKLPSDDWPELPSQEDTAQEEILLSLITSVLRDYCHRNNLAYSLLSKKQELRGLVRSYTRPKEAEVDHAFKTGWRKVVVGDLMERILRGECGIRVVGQGSKLGLSID